MAANSLARLRGKIGGLALAASHDPKVYTAAARAASPGSLSYWEARVDPDLVLSETERQRRAAARRRLHFVQLGYASVKARRRRRNGGGT